MYICIYIYIYTHTHTHAINRDYENTELFLTMLDLFVQSSSFVAVHVWTGTGPLQPLAITAVFRFLSFLFFIHICRTCLAPPPCSPCSPWQLLRSRLPFFAHSYVT